MFQRRLDNGAGEEPLSLHPLIVAPPLRGAHGRKNNECRRLWFAPRDGNAQPKKKKRKEGRKEWVCRPSVGSTLLLNFSIFFFLCINGTINNNTILLVSCATLARIAASSSFVLDTMTRVQESSCSVSSLRSMCVCTMEGERERETERARERACGSIGFFSCVANSC